jgi:hypothetical protein
LIRLTSPFGAARRTVKGVFLFFCFAALAQAPTHAGDDPSNYPIPFEQGSKVAPVISVCYSVGYPAPGSKPFHGVIACVWPDGRVVWSEDRTNGGAPYFTDRIEPKQLRKFMAALDTKGIFARKVWFNVGIDLPYYSINIIDGRRRLAIDASFDYGLGSDTPETITNLPEVLHFICGQLDELLPHQGTPLRKFDYELRMLR